MENLPKQLAEIFTGEGKSVTLAITSITLAIFGSTVHCACYSEYLSKRDNDAFSKLFEAFQVRQFIQYGTFQKVCEEFINERGQIRNIVEGLVMKNSVSQMLKPVDNRPKVVLIDEVDVFFSKDFYGNMYNPLAEIRHQLYSNTFGGIEIRKKKFLPLL